MLEDLGYAGKLAVGSEKRRDGVAIFYKTEKFNLKEYRTMLLNDLAKEYSPEVTQLQLGAGACAMLLETEGKLVLVCSVHISNHYWQPDAPCYEIGALIKKLEQFSKNYDPAPAIILCGDFNSQPTSPMYSILETGKISDAHKEEMAKCPLYELKTVSDMWSHNLKVTLVLFWY
jgi:endonuclease/exonuclease/phosphatase family metal-dependent hydrolase